MTSQTFFFYDLETSGTNPREDRIMQFAGQRTSLDLQPIGSPVNILIKMTDDVLPTPQAIMVTKITPQDTLRDGITEAEFARYVMENIFTPHTIVVGFNSVRFDDEFMRFLFWRNFYDPYEWEWKDGRSRWDILDVVRLTRALRPENIEWPFTEDGRATNRLELLTKLNGLSHEHAHDALSDVYATIAVAKLIRERQPELFNYLFKMRNKKEIQKLVNLDEKRPFVYASGRYPQEFNKTTVAFPLTSGRHGNVLVFDLRHNIKDLNPDNTFPIIKEFCFNKCPAVAPLGVLEKDNGWQKIGLSLEQIERNLHDLLANSDFAEVMRSQSEERPEYSPAVEPEAALYNGFLDDSDRVKVAAVRNADANRLADFHPDFQDERLSELLLHYKARNYPTSLSDNEAVAWENYRRGRLERLTPKFLQSLSEVYLQDEFIAEELKLYFENLLAEDY